jgi:hypothetical protein
MLNLYLDVFKSLNRRKVKYVVIGGVAAVVHGVPRATFDLDLLIEATIRTNGVSIPLASRKDLIRSKRAAGRLVDLEDVRLLNLPRLPQPIPRKPRDGDPSANE